MLSVALDQLAHLIQGLVRPLVLCDARQLLLNLLDVLRVPVVVDHRAQLFADLRHQVRVAIGGVHQPAHVAEQFLIARLLRNGVESLLELFKLIVVPVVMGNPL